jgi:hypothetical protein
LGEGKVLAIFTFSGVIAGTYLYAVLFPWLNKFGIPLEK